MIETPFKTPLRIGSQLEPVGHWLILDRNGAVVGGISPKSLAVALMDAVNSTRPAPGASAEEEALEIANSVSGYIAEPRLSELADDIAAALAAREGPLLELLKETRPYVENEHRQARHIGAPELERKHADLLARMDALEGK